MTFKVEGEKFVSKEAVYLTERKCLNEESKGSGGGKRGVPMGRAIKVLGGVSSNCCWEAFR